MAGGPCIKTKNIEEVFAKRRILLTNSLWDETPPALVLRHNDGRVTRRATRKREKKGRNGIIAHAVTHKINYT